MNRGSCTMSVRSDVMESGRSEGDIWKSNSIRENVKGKKCREM